MLGIALGLLSSLAWGMSDFIGGTVTRRTSALAVLAISQPVGLVVAVAAALALAEGPLPAEHALVAAGAGALAVLGLGAFYHAMALGSITVVATIGALGVLVPVTGGLIRGDDPTLVQAFGAAVAISGTLLVVREPDPEWRAAGRRAIGFAALAALGFGAFFLGIDRPADEDPAMAVLYARIGGVTVVMAGVMALALRSGRGIGLPLALLPLVALCGTLDITANASFALATNHGLLSLVAVAGSLYAPVTILLAWAILGDRMARSQRLGVVMALAGVALIASAA